MKQQFSEEGLLHERYQISRRTCFLWYITITTRILYKYLKEENAEYCITHTQKNQKLSKTLKYVLLHKINGAKNKFRVNINFPSTFLTPVLHAFMLKVTSKLKISLYCFMIASKKFLYGRTTSRYGCHPGFQFVEYNTVCI